MGKIDFAVEYSGNDDYHDAEDQVISAILITVLLVEAILPSETKIDT